MRPRTRGRTGRTRPVAPTEVPAQALFDHMGHQAANEIRQVPCLFGIALEPAPKLHEIGGIKKQDPDISKGDLSRHQSPSRNRAIASVARSGASNQYSSSSGPISVSITSRNHAFVSSSGSIGVI